MFSVNTEFYSKNRSYVFDERVDVILSSHPIISTVTEIFVVPNEFLANQNCLICTSECITYISANRNRRFY